MGATSPVRLPADVYDAAVAHGAVHSRSVQEQVTHWARIGRELEASPHVNHQAVTRVLAGEGSYDLLGEREQAIVRATWTERAEARRQSLDFEVEFVAAGESYSEGDEHGNVIIHLARDRD